MAIVVRRMAEPDLAALELIEREAFGAHRLSTAMDASQLRDELVRPWSVSWVALDGDRVVGFLLAWHVVDEIHVLNVAVKKTDRRRGIARTLLAELFAYTSARAVRTMYLEVRTGNTPAIELYRVHGFYASNVRKAYYSDGEDALEMRLDFDTKGGVLFREDEVKIPGRG
jgi:ribosomal-protein-alanine N-acetyltransferase